MRRAVIRALSRLSFSPATDQPAGTGPPYKTIRPGARRSVVRAIRLRPCGTYAAAGISHSSGFRRAQPSRAAAAPSTNINRLASYLLNGTPLSLPANRIERRDDRRTRRRPPPYRQRGGTDAPGRRQPIPNDSRNERQPGKSSKREQKNRKLRSRRSEHDDRAANEPERDSIRKDRLRRILFRCRSTFPVRIPFGTGRSTVQKRNGRLFP